MGVNRRVLTGAGGVFYSLLVRMVSGAPNRLDGQSGQQWLGWLSANASRHGVKDAEVRWSGLRAWLQVRERLSRGDVLDFVSSAPAVSMHVRQGDADYSAWLSQKFGLEIGEAEDSPQYDDDDVHAQFMKETGRPKFEGYQLPGGANYREILLVWDGAGAKPTSFVSEHWNQENVLCHIRVNDRVDDAGNCILFVEEIQSEWAQQGRRDGFYGGRFTQAEFDDMVGLAHKQQHAGPLSSEQETQLEGLRSRAYAATRSTPVGPFVERTQDWVSLALKSITHLAVQGGYQKVAFINAAQASHRFSVDDGGPGARAPSKGMVGFYDEILPRVVDKFLAPFDDARRASLVVSLKSIGANDPLLWYGVSDAGMAQGQMAFDVVEQMRQEFSDGASLFSMRGRAESAPQPNFVEDIPNDSWLSEKIEYAKSRGVNAWGVPYMSTATGYFRDPVEVPIDVLLGLSGQRGEQSRVRQDAIDWLTENWSQVADYAPYIEVAYNGQAWVSEGNHRIMVAAQKGLPSLKVDVRFFDGGQRSVGPLRYLAVPEEAEGAGPGYRERAR